LQKIKIYEGQVGLISLQTLTKLVSVRIRVSLIIIDILIIEARLSFEITNYDFHAKGRPNNLTPTNNSTKLIG